MSGKTALVVQGGSLRSVFTSGILDSFMASGFNPFDIYIGVSGGAMCMSYYIANQYRDTFQILSSIFSDEKFISLKQIFKTEGYVNLEYLQAYSLRHHPLILENAVANINNKLVEIVATNMADGEPVYLHPELNSWNKMMRASSTLPFLTKGYCMLNDLKLMDGGWSDPIPVKRAVDLGADKVVVIRTMPAAQKLEWSYFGWFGGFWHRNNPGLSKRFSEDHVYYNDSIDYIEENPKGAKIIQIAPEKELSTGSYSTSKPKLITDYRLGVDLGTQFLAKHKSEFL